MFIPTYLYFARPKKGGGPIPRKKKAVKPKCDCEHNVNVDVDVQQYIPRPIPTPYPNVDTKPPKPLWRSKNFWASTCFLVLSCITTMGSIEGFNTNPRYMGIAGIVFAIAWMVLRMITDAPVTPSINLPNPGRWGRKDDEPPDLSGAKIFKPGNLP